ncbi:LptF/LptG family permease [Acetobacteraceae bacterium]|nr:LptF/LptG family permease [Acetobacteraceae bacterium]
MPSDCYAIVNIILEKKIKKNDLAEHSAHLPQTLRTYVAKKFFLLTICATASLCLLINLFDLIDLLRKSAGHPQAGIWIAIKIALLHLPFYFLSIVPFGILLGGVSCFFFLARASEVTAARAAAISAWQFLTGPLLASLLIGIFAVLAISPLSATCYHNAAGLEEHYLTNQTKSLDEELWLKEKDNGLKEDGHFILHLYGISKISSKNKYSFLEAKRSTLLRLDRNNHFLRRVEAQETRLEKGRWVFKNTIEIIPGRAARSLPHFSLPTHLTAKRAKKIGVSADTLSIWNLPRSIYWLQEAGLPTRKQQLHLYTLLALPFLNATMLLIAAGFALRPFPQRQKKAITVIGMGIGTGFCLFTLSKIAEQLGNSGSIPPFFAATLPVLAGLSLAGSLLLKMEEG